jgi:hypothetical protein
MNQIATEEYLPEKPLKRACDGDEEGAMRHERWLRREARLMALGMVVLVMAACGGSSGNGAPPPDPDPLPPPPPPPAGFEVALSGTQEVPPVDTPASGIAELEIDLDTGAVSGILVVEDMEPTAAHIHDGFAGSNGPILVHLEQDAADPNRFSFAANAALTSAQLDRLLEGGLYLNVHSQAHPPGEVRGQILPAGFSLVFAELSGREQVPVQDTLARGRAAVTLDDSTPTTAAVHATLFGLGNATNVGLHEGFAGTTGPLLAALAQSTTDPNHWFSNGLELGDEDLEALRAGRAYLNASTTASPDGVIRGQFVPEGIAVIVDVLSGAEEVPPVDTTAAGTSALTLDLDSRAFEFHVNTTDFEQANAAHIHDGFAGTNGPVLVPLQRDGMNLARWSATGTFSAEDMQKLFAGALYINVHSPEHPPGEIRAQLKPDNIEVIFAALEGEQVVPPVVTTAGGLAAVTVDKEDRDVVAHVRLENLPMSTSGAIHRAPAGENGPELIALQQDTDDVNHWFGTGPLSDEGDFDAFLQDGLYVLIGSGTHPDGEIRGQLVREAEAAFPVAPVVVINSPEDGSTVNDTITVSASVDATEAIVEVTFLVDGTAIGSVGAEPYAIEWDTTTIADGAVTLTARAEDALGNVGVSAPVHVTVDNDEAAVAMTLEEIQAQVFTPRCSLCHTGGGTELPFTMNLSNIQASFDHLVSVPSEQVPALLRVHPGNPDDSYMIHKLEGTHAVGDRMPQGGPFLDEETIQGIRGWIAEGAAGPQGEPAPPPPPGYQAASESAPTPPPGY